MRFLWTLLLGLAALRGASNDYLSAQQKLDQISGERLRAGTRLTLSIGELNAWVAKEAPGGVRDTKVAVSAPGTATGSALIDFAKVERSQGREPGWLISHLLDGEHPVRVTARIRSSGGQATVDVDRVEISGLLIDGKTLQFLIENLLLPMYPDAAIGRSFELGHRIDRLDVQPAGVTVAIRAGDAAHLDPGYFPTTSPSPPAGSYLLPPPIRLHLRSEQRTQAYRSERQRRPANAAGSRTRQTL